MKTPDFMPLDEYIAMTRKLVKKRKKQLKKAKRKLKKAEELRKKIGGSPLVKLTPPTDEEIEKARADLAKSFECLQYTLNNTPLFDEEQSRPDPE